MALNTIALNSNFCKDSLSPRPSIPNNFYYSANESFGDLFTVDINQLDASENTNSYLFNTNAPSDPAPFMYTKNYSQFKASVLSDPNKEPVL